MNAFATFGIITLVSGFASVASAATIVNTADSLSEFSSTIAVGGDYGISANSGPAGAGDNAIFLIPRSDNSHFFSWNVDAMVTSADTLTVDVAKHEAFDAHATLTVRVYYDGLSTPHSPVIPELSTGNVITTTDGSYNTLTVSMPTSGGTHTIDRIDFLITQNNTIIYFDNFTLTAVPEPVSMSALGLGSMLLMRRRRA